MSVRVNLAEISLSIAIDNESFAFLLRLYLLRYQVKIGCPIKYRKFEIISSKGRIMYAGELEFQYRRKCETKNPNFNYAIYFLPTFFS